jgi:hypothetical protein
MGCIVIFSPSCDNCKLAIARSNQSSQQNKKTKHEAAKGVINVDKMAEEISVGL